MIRNENSKQRAARLANMLRNSKSRKSTELPGAGDRLRWISASGSPELLGVPFEIVSVEFDRPNPQYGGTQVVMLIELATGEQVNYAVPGSMKQQLENIPEDEYQDYLFTVVELDAYRDARGKRQHNYKLNYADMEETPENTPAKNRARVASERTAPPAKNYFADEDADDEDADDFDDEDEDDTPVAPQKRSQARQTASPAKSTKTPAPVKKPAPAPAKKSAATPGTITDFGSGDMVRGRGRPPSAVSAELSAGRNVWFSLKTGRYLTEDKKTVLATKGQ